MRARCFALRAATSSRWGATVSRFEQSRVAHRGRAFALIVAAAFAGACGDDSGDGEKDKEDSGAVADAATRDAQSPRDAAGDAANNVADAAKDAGTGSDAAADAAVDAGRDAEVDAGPPAVDGTDAPTITAAGFYTDELGKRILISGSDKNGDIDTYTIAFFTDANGTMPADVHTTGVGTDPTAQSTSGPIPHDEALQAFVLKLTPGDEVFDVAASIKVTVTDKGGRSSAAMLAKRGPAPMAGASCDPTYGFNRCATTSVCAPANNGNYSCQGLSSARMAACNSTSVLTLHPPSVLSVTGTLNAVSYWDMPGSCLGGGGATTGFADRIIKLQLDAPASKVILTTGMIGQPNGPQFDAVLYKLDACNTNPAACVDQNCTCGQYDLTLNNVPAGDTLIVVDSYPVAEATGGNFTVTATVQ